MLLAWRRDGQEYYLVQPCGLVIQVDLRNEGEDVGVGKWRKNINIGWMESGRI